MNLEKEEPIRFCPRMVKAALKRAGRKHSRETTFEISFALYTPKGHSNPAADEILIFDLLQSIQERMIAFHDVPGYELRQVIINREKVIG